MEWPFRCIGIYALHGPADPGVATRIKIGITGFPMAASGFVNKTDTLKTETDEADFLLRRWYYNIYTLAKSDDKSFLLGK